MLSTSSALRRRIAENSKVELKATLTLADETVISLTGEDFAMGGFSITQATSSMGGFDIGAAVIGACDVTLTNYDERFDPYDFTGATLEPYVGVTLPDNTVEWLRKGVYGVEQPDSYGSTISLHCLDNLRLLQRPYADVQTSYPSTLQVIVSNICTTCGVQLLTQAFPNSSYVVTSRPDSSNITCLDAISLVAQAAGCFVRCDEYGRLEVKWYPTTTYEGEGWLDGGTYLTSTTPYSDGDTADGGAFMSGGTTSDGGTFLSPTWAQAIYFSQLTVKTDDVVITGVRVTAHDEILADGTLGRSGETELFGSEGYVLNISDNPFIEFGKAATVAAQVGALVMGMRFRPFDATGLASPAWEAGDPIIVTDGRQRTYRAWLTSYIWKAGGYATMSCSAETPARNSATSAGAMTKAIVDARNAIRAEQTARAVAVANLANQLATASGLYKTEEQAQGGGTIYYLHDKPTLATSIIVWKMTASAFGVSVDGGTTYPFGFDAWGNAILNAIYAIGIDAQYITTGTLLASIIHGGILTLGGTNNENGILQVKDTSGTVVGQFDNSGLMASGDLEIRNATSNLKATARYIPSTFYPASDSAAIDGYGFVLKSQGIAYSAWALGNTIQLFPHPTNGYNVIYSSSSLELQAQIAQNHSSQMQPSDDAIKFIIGAGGIRLTQDLLGNLSANGMFRVTASSGALTCGPATIQGWTRVMDNLTVTGNITASGTKSRLVDTDAYGDRLLYCDETPSPTFTDFGSGTIGDDGLCYVEIDAIFAETARTDMAYQVFLQKCGPGDLWVSEKLPGWFVVEGTPGLAFDWQLKAHQAGFEHERLEDHGIVSDLEQGESFLPDEDRILAGASVYATEIEQLYRADMEQLHGEESAA